MSHTIEETVCNCTTGNHLFCTIISSSIERRAIAAHVAERSKQLVIIPRFHISTVILIEIAQSIVDIDIALKSIKYYNQ